MLWRGAGGGGVLAGTRRPSAAGDGVPPSLQIPPHTHILLARSSAPYSPFRRRAHSPTAFSGPMNEIFFKQNENFLGKKTRLKWQPNREAEADRRCRKDVCLRRPWQATVRASAAKGQDRGCSAFFGARPRARPVVAVLVLNALDPQRAAHMWRRSMRNVYASLELARAHDCREADALRPAPSP